MELPDWPLVSVLFITYKRFDFLQRAVHGFRQNTDYPNLEIVISDDGSGTIIQDKIRNLQPDVCAFFPKRRGLGANNNHGLSRCRGKYILMIQDDWPCHGPSDYLRNAVAVMEANPEVGIINFGGAPHPPDHAQGLKGSDEPCYVTPVPCTSSNREEFLYSDQPHLQSRTALDFIGPYIEHRDMGRCEVDYSQRWKHQSRFLTAVFPAYHRQVFSDEGQDVHVSHRQRSFRFRLDRMLLPAALFLKSNCRPLYKLGRASVRLSVSLMEKLRVVR